MRGRAETSSAGRIAALATMAVSAALFGTALFGISSIDPGADAAPAPAPSKPASGVALQNGTAAERDDDCPWRDRDKPKRRVHS